MSNGIMITRRTKRKVPMCHQPFRRGPPKSVDKNILRIFYEFFFFCSIPSSPRGIYNLNPPSGHASTLVCLRPILYTAHVCAHITVNTSCRTLCRTTRLLFIGRQFDDDKNGNGKLYYVVRARQRQSEGVSLMLLYRLPGSRVGFPADCVHRARVYKSY